MKLNKDKLTKKLVCKIISLALENDSVDTNIDESEFITSKVNDNWTLKVPGFYQGGCLNGAPDMYFTISSDGFMSFENWSGVKFKYYNALKCYQILLQAID